MKTRVIVTGYMTRCPVAGVVWQHLHYIIGLQRLGYDVTYIEDSSVCPFHAETWDVTSDFSANCAVMDRLGREFNFAWGYRARYLDGMPTAGLSAAQIVELYDTAEAVFNVCGEQELHDDLLRNRALLYIESDPGLEQCRIDNEPAAPLLDVLRHYRAVFTFGENIGTDLFPVPLHGVRWLPTRQPVVTDIWRAATPPASDAVFTTIANWNTKGKDVLWRGDTYLWSKALEFLKFQDAPQHSGETFEMATNLSDPPTRELMTARGWRLIPPGQISADHQRYLRYIQESRGEFTVAKDQYVRLNTAWFSDRTVCYLAAARPVITQETGFTRLYGGDAGLLAFSTLDDIAEAARAIRADYEKHSRAAFEVAAEFFEAEKVCASILARAGL